MKWLCSSWLCYNNPFTKTETSDKIKYLKIQRHNRKILNKFLAKDNWKKMKRRPQLLRALVKKDFLINIEDRQNAIAPYS